MRRGVLTESTCWAGAAALHLKPPPHSNPPASLPALLVRPPAELAQLLMDPCGGGGLASPRMMALELFGGPISGAKAAAQQQPLQHAGEAHQPARHVKAQDVQQAVPSGSGFGCGGAGHATGGRFSQQQQQCPAAAYYPQVWPAPGAAAPYLPAMEAVPGRMHGLYQSAHDQPYISYASGSYPVISGLGAQPPPLPPYDVGGPQAAWQPPSEAAGAAAAVAAAARASMVPSASQPVPLAALGLVPLA